MELFRLHQTNLNAISKLQTDLQAAERKIAEMSRAQIFAQQSSLQSVQSAGVPNVAQQSSSQHVQSAGATPHVAKSKRDKKVFSKAIEKRVGAGVVAPKPAPIPQVQLSSNKMTHFVSLPIVNPSVVEGVARIQQSMAKAHPILRSGMIELTRLHISLAVFRCDNNEVLAQVREALKSKAQDIIECMKNQAGSNVSSLKIAGLAMFGNQVLWMKISNHDFLQKVSSIVLEAIKSVGRGVQLASTSGDNQFHLTIWKLSNMKDLKDVRKTLMQISSTLVFNQWANQSVGEERLAAIHLCAMTGGRQTRQGRLYKVESFIKLTASSTCLPSVVSWNSNYAKDYQKASEQEERYVQAVRGKTSWTSLPSVVSWFSHKSKALGKTRSEDTSSDWTSMPSVVSWFGTGRKKSPA
eukprot:765826-Hanusia_phi.AAC.3